MKRPPDGPDRLLRTVAWLLPDTRREWGRAMRAELAALDAGRWGFALGSTRAALTRMPTVARLVRAGGLALVASEVLTLVAQGRSDPSLVAVWTVLLTVYTLALLRVTARRPRVSAGTLAAGAGGGLIVAAAWVAAAVLEPSVPTANGPATVAIAAAALCAACAARRGAERQIAGLCAAAGCALLIAVTIDGPLRLFPAWVSTNAPPVDSPETAARLVDSIGIWVLGCLFAAALTLAIRPASVSGDLPGAGTPSRDPAPARRAS